MSNSIVDNDFKVADMISLPFKSYSFNALIDEEIYNVYSN